MSTAAVTKHSEVVSYFNMTFKTKSYIFHQGPTFIRAHEKSEQSLILRGTKDNISDLFLLS